MIIRFQIPVILRVLSIQFPTDAPKQITDAAIMSPYIAVSRRFSGASFIMYNPPANHHLDKIQTQIILNINEYRYFNTFSSYDYDA